jgi:hypothetical protein
MSLMANDPSSAEKSKLSSSLLLLGEAPPTPRVVLSPRVCNAMESARSGVEEEEEEEEEGEERREE